MTETAIAAESHSEVTPQDGQVSQEAATDPSEKPDPNVTANGDKLDRQTRNWRALETDRDHWRDLAMQFARPAQETPPAPTPAEPEKTLADFDFDDVRYQAYVRQSLRTALSAEARAAAKAELAAEREQQESHRRTTSFKGRESEFAKTVEDYNDVARNPSLPVTRDMAEVIQDSDDGPALLYHLGKNPDIAEKIAMLPPKAAARELGKIEARLAFEREKAKPEKVSKAPPPPPKVEGADGALPKVSTTDPESDKLSDDEWVKAEQARLKRKQQKRA